MISAMNLTLKLQLAAMIAAASLLGACASRPPNVTSIEGTADASQELESTQQMLSEAKGRSLDVLAPTNFKHAEDSLSDAREALTKGKNKEKVLEKVADARGWLAEAESKGKVASAATGTLGDARTGAMKAKAGEFYPKEYAKLEDQLLDATKAAEKGDVAEATNESKELIKKYRELEVKAVQKAYLGEAQINMAAAKKEKSEKEAPKTYKLADQRLNAAMETIQTDPRNKDAISRAAASANDTTQFLLVVTKKVKEGNTEDLVLQSEKQRHTISGLAATGAQTESALEQTAANLAQKDTALKTADSIRAQLKPTEAEVFVENNAVKVRLKGLQFPTNRATLNNKGTALLQKVDGALNKVSISKITVEGHTDSVGDPEKNQAISQLRAQAVQNFLVSKGQIPEDRVSAVGKGAESPISDNGNARGRAENRRIDLVIEPGVPAPTTKE
jgi:OOP family OmpA-OmpF porin